MFQGYTSSRESDAYLSNSSPSYNNYNPKSSEQKKLAEDGFLEELLKRCNEAVQELNERVDAAA